MLKLAGRTGSVRVKASSQVRTLGPLSLFAQAAVVPGDALRLPQSGPDSGSGPGGFGSAAVAAGTQEDPPGSGGRGGAGLFPPVLQRRRRRRAGPVVLPEGPHEPVPYQFVLGPTTSRIY